jgi:hypothetical protein
MRIPRGGTSLEHKIYIDNAPDVDLVAHLSIPSIQASGITITPEKLEF